METIASLIKSLALTKGDAAVIGVGTSVPLLMGAVAGVPANDIHTLIMGAVAAAVSTALTVGIKGAAAAAGAWLRSDKKKKLADNDPKNDNAAEAEGAFADKIDPPGKA